MRIVKECSEVLKKMKAVRLIISDVDGTLARRLMIDSDGNDIKVFCEKDGYMILGTVRAGIPFAILSGRNSNATRVRADGLGVPFFTRDELSEKVNFSDPLEFFEKKYEVSRKEIMYIGDGWLDLWWLSEAGVSVVPSDADPECLAIADIVTDAEGGEGVVAEVLAELLKEKGLYVNILSEFYQPL